MGFGWKRCNSIGSYCYCCLVTKSGPTLCYPMDYSPLGSSVHGILQAKILEWVSILFSRGSSWPKDWTRVSFIASRFFTIWATRLQTGKWNWELSYFHWKEAFKPSLWHTRITCACALGPLFSKIRITWKQALQYRNSQSVSWGDC